MTEGDSGEQPDALYDAHAHFFTNDLRRYPVDTTNAREGEERLRRRILSDPATAQRVLSFWDESRVVGGVAVQYATVYKRDNSFALDVGAAHAQRISTVLLLDAAAAETPAVLEKLIVERGAVGLRLNGPTSLDGSFPWLDSPAALKTWAVAERHALTMVLLYSPARISPPIFRAFAGLAERFPSTRIVLDHFGWATCEPMPLELAIPLVRMREHANVFFKLTTINLHMLEEGGVDSAEFVRRSADVFGADHLLWGSDVGNTLESYPAMAERARSAAALLTPAERKLFLCETGAALFSRR